jgi:glycosyltransferase involved in cell wall biosynthesis
LVSFQSVIAIRASFVPEKSRKVLLVSGRFQVRGSFVQTLNLARYLPDHGFETEVVCPDARLLAPERRAELNVTEVAYVEVPVLRRIVRRLFIRELAKDPPDLIHIQQRSAAWLGVGLATALRCPYVMTVHDYLSPREKLLLNLRLPCRVIAVSDSVKAELMERTSLAESLLTVIPSGVEIPPEEELRRPFDNRHTPVVGTAGPLEAARGLHFFLRAIPKVLANHRPVEFLIAGAGPEEFALRRLADDLGITEFLTFVPNVFDLSSALSAMDLYCLPSLKQGLGTVMLEAMARGRPVIASKVGGVYGVIDDGVNGLLVPPSDSDSLAARIIELLANPTRAQQIGDAARRQVATQFPVRTMVEQTLAVYETVLAQSRQVASPATAG